MNIGIKMKRVYSFLLVIFFTGAMVAQEVQSPDGALKVRLTQEEESLRYEVEYRGKTMIEPSSLGLETSIGDFSGDLRYVDCVTRRVDETYALPHGKVSRVHYVANELTATYTNAGNDSLDVIFRVADNEIALAYRIRSKDQCRCTIYRERTGFDFPAGTTTFITPQAPAGSGWMKSKPSYEEEYTVEEPVGTPSRYGLGYTFPALFHVGNDGWVLISETGVSSKYGGTRLSEGTAEGLYTIEFPMEGENGGMGDATVTAALPLLTSWKTLTVGETLKPIVETTSACNGVEPLYEPSKDYVPGRSTWSWILWQDASCNYEDQQTFIDLAAVMGYEYILVDALWDKQIGYENMPSLIAYAQQKGVDVLLWYNSNGAWNDAPQGPKHRMDTAPARRKEMEWMKKLGVKGIKVDFFGGDKQTTMKLYEDILTDANHYGLFVNFHGTTLPRGWERMYPNHFTSEATLASENLVFSQDFADKEAFVSTILPFTRNAVAAMDFGPVFFNRRFSKDDSYGNYRRTTDAFQVATSILYQSPLQHFGIMPNNLEEQPDYVIDFMKKVPVVWDETRFVDGYPGKFCVIARRAGDKWYVVATHADRQPKELKLSLPWLAGKQVNMLYDKDDRTAGLRVATVDKKGNLTIRMQGLGGAVVYTD